MSWEVKIRYKLERRIEIKENKIEMKYFVTESKKLI